MKYAPSFKDHILRYAFAMPYAWKRDTLDLGGKEGFGTQILSYVAKSVTNADIDKEWLERSMKHYYWCPASTQECNFDVQFPEGTWDTIVSFELIEHVDDPDKLMKNIAEHLRPDGRLVFSVPHMVANDEHKTLFDEQKIKDLVSKYLDIQEFYVQDHTYLSGKPLYRGLVCYVGVAKKREN